MGRVRHVRTVGQVKPAVLDAVVQAWNAEKVNQSIAPSDVVLVLVDQDSGDGGGYIGALIEADRNRCPVAIIPSVSPYQLSQITGRLGDEPLTVDFQKCRFRFNDSAQGVLAGAPEILQRALADDQGSVMDDLASADLLFLDGHGGPVDGGFGRWLILCSRNRYSGNPAPVFSCFGTPRCFRQQHYLRPATSIDGLVDPVDLRVPLLVLNGCGTVVIPGSQFSYETSLARSILTSGVRAAVMTHGLSATSRSALIVFLGSLARGMTLGEAVRCANTHMQAIGTPSSVEGAGAAPWVLLGNPELLIEGIPLVEKQREPTTSEVAFRVDDMEIPARTGVLVSLDGVHAQCGPLDLSCGDGRWARGVLDGNDRAYVWLACNADAPSGALANVPVLARLAPSRSAVPAAWRRRSQWVRVNCTWLDRLGSVVTDRGGDPVDVQSALNSWKALSDSIEQVAFAASSRRELVLAPPLGDSIRPLLELMERLDRRTALSIATAIQFTGARITRFWYPPWLGEGFTRIEEICSCGCPVAATVLKHSVSDLRRILLTCPACGPIGDVTAECVETNGSSRIAPTILAIPQRKVKQGEPYALPIRRLGDDPMIGCACVAMVDSFRERHCVSELVEIGPQSETSLTLTTTGDWPVGLSQIVAVIVIGGELSFLDFDVVVVGN